MSLPTSTRPSPSRTRLWALLLLGLAMLLAVAVGKSSAAGILFAKGSPDQPIQIREHHLDVVINNGFARTQVTQTFFNPNARDLEAVYSFPVPQSASLSEVTIWNGEKEIQGEVVEKQEAERIYKKERDQGNESGIASKNSFYTYDFGVSPVRANSEVRIQFVYYQPLEIDTGVGRYVYPLHEGGTDDAALSFWTTNSKVENAFTATVEVKSAVPLADVRIPGAAGAAVEKVDDGHWRVKLDEPAGASLDRDLVVYYKQADNLPGRVEVIAHRADESKPGTFMLVVTPGIDLKPLTGGSDYVFVLDVSGSMQQKIATLADGVTKVLGQMRPEDRFRVITFNNSATEVVPWTTATPQNVLSACEQIKSLHANGSTNMYDGVSLALRGLDADRATSIVLVTDGVTNTGVIDPKAFHQLVKTYDVRIFGFLMGNSANWPLMRTVCDATGGFYAGVSNDDDIVGKIILAKGKIVHESLHDASVSIKGVETEKVTDVFLGKVYRGQQLVLFGQYEKPGKATVTLRAKLTGEDKTYTTTFDFPALDTDNPEVERLFAMNQVELVEAKQNRGELDADESRAAIRNIGVEYQLVTDHTSMLVLGDDAFARHGIDRKNQKRVATERQAQAVRSNQPARNNRVDQNQPAFSGNSPHIGNGNGGGAIDPISGLAVVGLAALALTPRRKRGRR